MGKVVGGIGTLGGFIGDPLGHEAIDEGVDAQRISVEQANNLLKDEYGVQKGYLEPWQKGGLTAFSSMSNPDFQRDFQMSDFQKDPGYEFRMAEGAKALERSAAAKGGLMSGGFGKALSRYSQDFASNEYNNAYNRFNADRDRRFGRLNTMAGYGQNAANGLVQASQNYGRFASDNLTGLGNARAAGKIAQANANQKFLSGLMELGGRAASGGAA